jgi:hypothetical protein
MKLSKSKVVIPREVLLVEIERRCPALECNTRVRVGLTKTEARIYCGFECERCGQFWDDVLTERDVPEWWEELAVTGLHTVRENPLQDGDESNEVVKRMSDSYRRTQRESAEDIKEDSF